MNKIGCLFSVTIFYLLSFSLNINYAHASEIYVGKASVDITPPLPVALDGQFHTRVANKADNPVTANILILSAGSKNNSAETSIMVSCDLVGISPLILKGVRDFVSNNLPGVDPGKVMISATHTHTGPVVQMDMSAIPYLIPEGVTSPAQALEFIVKSINNGIMQAWKNQQKATVTWGIDHAKVAYNRRASYDDGSAKMYGNTAVKEFRKIEGPEDESINSLFFWNTKGELMAACINIACPAQIVEGRNTVNADFWHFVRRNMQQRWGKQLVVLGWTGAAGDQSPRPMYQKAAELRMTQLRSSIAPENIKLNNTDFQTENYLQEIAGRITDAVVRSYEAVKADKHPDVAVKHTVTKIDLPMRIISEKEYWEIKHDIANHSATPEEARKNYGRINWNQGALDRYKNQLTVEKPVYETEVQVLRIGDVAICTNPFELYTDYGVQMKARSKALQTFVLQLTGRGTYLPTKAAVKGGHYSATPQSNMVGPEGGQMLVERTVQLINELW